MTVDQVIKDFVECKQGIGFTPSANVAVLVEEIKRLRNARVLGMEEAAKITEGKACENCIHWGCVAYRQIAALIRKAAKQ